ncbi:MAG: MotA/TolQ/ExbB proton channel family protein [Cyclobacteriaceae bacterium]|nr:MotA/TolQ/ExbB proton channel family protein [Cyclobacteriaceae bacterium]
MSILDFHREGGMIYMAPLTIIFLINLGLIFYGFYVKMQHKAIQERLLETIKQLSGFALAFGAFGTLIGLFFAFGSLSEMSEALPLSTIMGGLKVAMYTTLYGFIIFIVTQIALLLFRLFDKS